MQLSTLRHNQTDCRSSSVNEERAPSPSLSMFSTERFKKTQIECQRRCSIACAQLPSGNNRHTGVIASRGKKCRFAPRDVEKSPQRCASGIFHCGWRSELYFVFIGDFEQSLGRQMCKVQDCDLCCVSNISCVLPGAADNKLRFANKAPFLYATAIDTRPGKKTSSIH